MTKLTLGSLFSGSGGFELAGQLAGIKPIWQSEIEPFAIAVERKNFPDVKHYGDVSALNGAELESVDIVTFGSPCQDMSMAGRRDGLSGSRSCLFWEAIRIIKEMRCATDEIYPRFAVWENVPGAFSSNGGEDFRSVLEAFCSVKDESISVSRPARWTNAGEILADGFSVAWRVLDAQYWGVPQRRKRIYLVADFASGSAGKVLFESEGLSGYSAESFRAWQRAAKSPERRIRETGEQLTFHNVTDCLCASYATKWNGNGAAYNGSLFVGDKKTMWLNDQGGDRINVDKDISCTLRAQTHGHPLCVVENQKAYGIGGYNSEGMLSDNPKAGFYEADTSRTLDTAGGNPGCQQGGIAVVRSCAIQGNIRPSIKEKLQPTMVSNDPGAVGTEYMVRRLTPTECARLQGFPDWWCRNLGDKNPTEEDLRFWADVWETHRRLVSHSGKPKTEKQLRKWLASPYTDAAEYKLWGNGIALPCAYFVLAGIAWYAQFPSD